MGSELQLSTRSRPDESYVSIGFFDHPERFPPVVHAYWQMKLPWLEFADNLPRIDGYSRKRDESKGNPVDRAHGTPGIAVLKGK
jgi:hypothetical protein